MKAGGRTGFAILAGVAFALTAARAVEPVTASIMSRNDAFVLTGSADNPNMGGDGQDHDLTDWCYGGAGTLVISSGNYSYVDPYTGNTLRKGEYQSLVMFSAASAISLFDATYGAGKWVITSISLEFTSNWGAAGAVPNNPIFSAISGGQFVIEWLSDDNWVEGTGNPSAPTQDGVTYDSLDTLLLGQRETLGTYAYAPPGQNVHLSWNLPLTKNLLADVATGEDLSFRLYAADDSINYLFNSHNYGRATSPTFTSRPYRSPRPSRSWPSPARHPAGGGCAGPHSPCPRCWSRSASSPSPPA